MRNPSPAPLDRDLVSIPGSLLFAIELLALLVVLACGWKARSLWPALPFADPDTWGYLSPALSWLSGGGLRQTDGRDWLYPALVALFLKTSGSFAGIVIWQYCFGLLSGVLMAVAWRCWVSLLPYGRWIQLLLSLLGAAPIYVQLISPQNILFERSIRPEAILAFFVYAQLACVIGYAKYRWQSPRGLPALWLGTGAIVLSFACLVLKPSWYLACALTSLPVFAGVFGRAIALRTRLLAPAAGIALSLVFLWLPAKIWMIHDSVSRTFFPFTLFCVHAPVIDQWLEARYSALPGSDPEKARLRTFLAVFEDELRTATNDPSAFELLGINPDYLMYNSHLAAAIRDYTGGDRDKFRSFCFGSYLNAVTHYPWACTKKVLLQFTHFLYPAPKSFLRDNIDFARLYLESARPLESYTDSHLSPPWQAVFRRYREEVAAQIGSAGELPRIPSFRAWGKRFARWALPVEILFLVALMATLAWAPLGKLRLGGWTVLFLFFAPFGNALGVCIVHALDIDRYCFTYAGFLLFALTAMAAFIVLVLAQALLKPLTLPSR